MAKAIIVDKTLAILEPLIPVKPRRAKHPERKSLENRVVLTGIELVLRTGISWERLPALAENGLACHGVRIPLTFSGSRLNQCVSGMDERGILQRYSSVLTLCGRIARFD